MLRTKNLVSQFELPVLKQFSQASAFIYFGDN